MFDYGFPHPITEEDRKKSKPFVYVVAAISLAAYATFAIYEVKHQEKVKSNESPRTISTNNLEKVVEKRK